MKSKSAILIALVLATLTACDSRATYPGDETKSYTRLRLEDYARATVRDLVYVKDKKTDLCYAYTTRGSGNTITEILTNVPCEQAEKELVKQ